MTRHDHETLLASIPAYVLGALDRADSEALEQHLAAGCAECDEAMLQATRGLEALADTVEPVAPSDLVRGRVLAQTVSDSEAHAMETQPIEPVRRIRWWPVVAAASLAVLVWSGFEQRELRRQVEGLALDRDHANESLRHLERSLGEAEQRLRRYELASRIAASPAMRTVRLAGLEAAPEAQAQALIEGGEAKAVLYVSNLQPAGADRTYQLWIIVGGTPVSAGLFDVDAGGGASVLVEDLERLDEIEAWAVTLEPSGGVPQPTGPMVLMGTA